MYKHILVPTDGSTLSGKAARAAARLAKSTGARITAIYAVPPFAAPLILDGYPYMPPYTQADYDKGMRKEADKAIGKVQAEAKKTGVKCTGEMLKGDDPWKVIIKAARANKCDLIVMASHGRRGLAGVLLGSETTKVLTHSKVPVLVGR